MMICPEECFAYADMQDQLQELLLEARYARPDGQEKRVLSD